jgi:pyruvate dehydrogenase E2 component (dihydrolipoamide acetyltransferase)
VQGKLIEPTRMRATIARRMTESKQQIPHFYAQTEVMIDGVRGRLAELDRDADAPRATMTVALVRACVASLRANPLFNSVWTPDGLLQVDAINLGVAIALDDGLIAPALLEAGDLGVRETAAALSDLALRARSQRLRPREITDGTFTLSNLGMFNVSAFTAIVMPPQIAILATARATERLVVRDGPPGAVGVMTVTLSADHRAVNGTDAARFLEAFKEAMEDPDTLLAERNDQKETMS